MPRIFPVGTDNIAIGVSSTESRHAYSVFITKTVPSMHAADMVGSQFFPLNLYEESSSATLFYENESEGMTRSDGVTDWALKRFNEAYQ